MQLRLLILQISLNTTFSYMHNSLHHSQWPSSSPLWIQGGNALRDSDFAGSGEERESPAGELSSQRKEKLHISPTKSDKVSK